jgi:hypothetical protein
MSKSKQQIRAEIERVTRLARFQDADEVRQQLAQYVAERMAALEPERRRETIGGRTV